MHKIRILKCMYVPHKSILGTLSGPEARHALRGQKNVSTLE